MCRILGFFAIHQILLGWKQYEHYYETVELPTTQGQPNPPKIMLKVAFGPLFPTKKKLFRGLGLVLYTGNRLQETQPNQILRKHPISSGPSVVPVVPV